MCAAMENIRWRDPPLIFAKSRRIRGYALGFEFVDHFSGGDEVLRGRTTLFIPFFNYTDGVKAFWVFWVCWRWMPAWKF